MSPPRRQNERRRPRSWLPRASVAQVPADAPPWTPPGFARKQISWRALSYIVVDELVSGVAGLVVSDWPVVDERGRVRSAGATWRVGAQAEELESLLEAERRLSEATPEPEVVRARPVRIGDAFAAKTMRPPGRAAVPSLRRWLKPPIYDLSADAREAAKAALYGALAPTMSEAEIEDIAAEALDQRRLQRHRRRAKGQ